MKAIILAAGRGSRMGAITKKQPKCLTIINKKPLIEHQILALQQAGTHEIAIVTGYQSECLQRYGTRHFYNKEWGSTNMVFSLTIAQEWLNSDDCIVSYSDIIYEKNIIMDLMKSRDDVTVAYDPNWLNVWKKRFNDPLEDAETFRIDTDGYITEIGNKAQSVNEIQGQYMGLLKFKKGIFSLIVAEYKKKLLTNIDMTSFLKELIVSRKKIKGVANIQPWWEFDSQHDIESYI